jgi:hypothetical protein
MRGRLIALSAAVAVGAGLVGAAPAAAVPCAGLQAALDAAPDNGTVVVDEATCHDMSFTLKSRPPTASVTVEGAGHGTTFDGGDDSSPTPRIMTGEDVGGVTLRNMTFLNSSSPSDDGGALKITGHSTVTLEGLTFMENRAPDHAGGGAYIQSISATPVAIRDSLFGDPNYVAGNFAQNGGGLALAGGPGVASVDIANSRIDGNSVTGNGSGLYVSSYDPDAGVSIVDSEANDNVAGGNGGGAFILAPRVTIERSRFANNSVSTGLSGHHGGSHAGGGLFVGRSVGEGRLDQELNRFERNGVGVLGPNPRAAGGGEWIQGLDTTSTRDRFTSNGLNAADGGMTGGGLGMTRCHDAATFRAADLVAAGNSASAGGRGAGVFAGSCAGGTVNMTILNSTIAGNTTHGGAATAGLYGAATALLTLRNSIVAGNPGAAQLRGFQRRAIRYSDTCAPGVVPGAGNICADPVLADPSADVPDVHQTQLSPTIDRGCNCLVPATPALAHEQDFESDVRVLRRVDMGADEYAAPWPLAARVMSVGRVGATLEVVSPDEACFTQLRFQYGLTSAYGRVTRPLGADRDCRPLPAHLTGLQPGRRYHFRLVATNRRGTTLGRDQTFRTRP